MNSSVDDAAERPRLLRFLPRALREPRRPGRAILTGWALAFFPSLILSAATRFLLPHAARPEFDIDGTAAIAVIVVAAPLLETMIMAAVLEALLFLRLPPTAAILVSAAGWGAAHSLIAPAWGLVIWWPFLIFSTLYITWRRRGILAAIGVAFATHALQNSIPALLLLRLA